MISLEDAQARLLALLPDLPVETRPLSEALGRWLATDLHAVRTQPARDLSAMDGYAIASEPTAAMWEVVGESAAGKPFRFDVTPGKAVRIFTGAALPQGTDSVIIQENIARNGVRIEAISGSPIRKGQHVRKRGSDFCADQLLIPAGTRIDARIVALAAMAGHDRLAVRRRVRVALVSTGDELVAPGMACDDDHIPASNAVMIAAMLSAYPTDIVDLGIIPDRSDAISAAIRRASDCDIIVTIGGASVGDHDLVRPALLKEGAQIDFWKVAMRPGKPMIVGRLGESLVLGLPGNPVSAFVTATLFLIPALSAIAGATSPFPLKNPARLGAALPAVEARTDHIRAIMTDSGVIPVGIDDSAALKGLALAQALIVREAGSKAAEIGEIVPVIILS